MERGYMLYGSRLFVSVSGWTELWSARNVTQQ